MDNIKDFANKQGDHGQQMGKKAEEYVKNAKDKGGEKVKDEAQKFVNVNK
ncbi:HHR231Cp [Eremothecium sinecaudum]|uniref:HHR231Cp n=1 Tax=Eremothecium sinecaudum TaxID=45286 RepID=A0A0X8HX17_9SACH|nr:HHR231Cp [Eremothecium sinecaudum]AMD23000.1 HHR231Cp [Eremothecium sinecaudum]